MGFVWFAHSLRFVRMTNEVGSCQRCLETAPTPSSAWRGALHLGRSGFEKSVGWPSSCDQMKLAASSKLMNAARLREVVVTVGKKR